MKLYYRNVQSDVLYQSDGFFKQCGMVAPNLLYPVGQMGSARSVYRLDPAMWVVHPCVNPVCLPGVGVRNGLVPTWTCGGRNSSAPVVGGWGEDGEGT